MPPRRARPMGRRRRRRRRQGRLVVDPTQSVVITGPRLAPVRGRRRGFAHDLGDVGALAEPDVAEEGPTGLPRGGDVDDGVPHPLQGEDEGAHVLEGHRGPAVEEPVDAVGARGDPGDEHGREEEEGALGVLPRRVVGARAEALFPGTRGGRRRRLGGPLRPRLRAGASELRVLAVGGGRDADGVGRERVSGAWCYGTVRGRRRGRGCGCCLRGDGDFRHLLVSAGRLGLDVVRSQRAGVEFQELLPPFVDGTTCAAIYEKGNENHDPGYLHVS